MQQNDIFDACKSGNYHQVKILIENHRASVNVKNDHGLTPLHWAVFSNSCLLVDYLIGKGAEVDAVGGEASTTPLHWAVKHGRTQIVALLLSHHVDPSLVDIYGNNVLHLATYNDDALLFLYLVQLGFTSIDDCDGNKRTVLHLIANRGRSSSMLKFAIDYGCDINRLDEHNATALHYACFNGNTDNIHLLLKAGCDYHHRDVHSKTPREILAECFPNVSFDVLLAQTERIQCKTVKVKEIPNRKLVIKKETFDRFHFVLGWGVLPFSLWIFSVLKVWISIPLLFVMFYGHFWIVTNAVVQVGGVSTENDLASSPFLSAVVQSSMATAFLVYCQKILPTVSLPYALCMGAMFLITVYCYYRTMLMDPGFLNKDNDDEQRHVSDTRPLLLEDMFQLMNKGILDNRHFCHSCKIRKPLRSKHCKVCGRCVARFDHHCPWTYCCIGAKNARPFSCFIFIGFVLFCMASSDFFYYTTTSSRPSIPEEYMNGCTLPHTLCLFMYEHSYTLLLAMWITFNMLWVLLLVIAQMYHISENLTTNESSNYTRLEYLREDEYDLKSDYHNPFNKGCWRNWVDYFYSSPSSWLHVYDKKDISVNTFPL